MTIRNTVSFKRNPLSGKNITGIGTWDQWRALWQQTNQAEMLASLLHYGFDTTGNIVDQVIFYLQVAHAGSIRPRSSDAVDVIHSGSCAGGGFAVTVLENGISNAFTENADNGMRKPMFNFSGSQSEYGKASSLELRQIVADKALEVLCLRFFSRKFNLDYWEKNHDLLKSLLVWFKPKENQPSYRLDNKHHRKVFTDFCEQFVERSWDYATEDTSMVQVNEGRKKLRATCRRHRPIILALAKSCGGLNNIHLLKKILQETSLPLDEKALAFLQECARDNQSRDCGLPAGASLEQLAWVHNEPHSQLIMLLQERDRMRTQLAEK